MENSVQESLTSLLCRLSLVSVVLRKYLKINCTGCVFFVLRVLSEVQIRLDDPPPHGDVADHDEDEGQGEADAEEEGARVDKSGLRVNHVTLP